MSLRPNLEVWDLRVEICAVRQLPSGALGGARVRAPGAAGGVAASRVCPRGLRSDPCSPGREFPHASGSPGPFPAKLSPRARAAVLWDGDEPAATALGALCLASPRIGLRHRAPSSASKSLEETLKHHHWPPFKCAFFPPRPPFLLASGVLSRALPATAAVVPASGPCGPSRRGARRADTHAPVCGSALAARLSLRCRPAPSRERRRPAAGALASPRVRPRGRGPSLSGSNAHSRPRLRFPCFPAASPRQRRLSLVPRGSLASPFLCDEKGTGGPW